VDAPEIVPRTTAVAIMLLMMVMLKLVTTAASMAAMAAEMMVEDIDCKYVHTSDMQDIGVGDDFFQGSCGVAWPSHFMEFIIGIWIPVQYVYNYWVYT
jgi:hypothetical protein